MPGSPGWALLGSLLKDDSDFIIRKTLNDAFSKTDLDLCLRNLGVERLIISGWATDFCVDSTIRSAVAIITMLW
ncbi:cysteine hydrolase family protein [Microbulbifer sp. GL-2]|uniref:cysteine hydrolase family protein n=1 Tax=Microbulbifer sp. GL-2 TaxID=2591606 RepID=UPI001163B2A8|nr:hypothetical protein GL2_43380 [Microbulbifer sp. GL-2]